MIELVIFTILLTQLIAVVFFPAVAPGVRIGVVRAGSPGAFRKSAAVFLLLLCGLVLSCRPEGTIVQGSFPGVEFFLPVVAFAIVTMVSPGPANAMIAASAANFGIARAWRFGAGVCFGLVIQILLVGFGLAGIFQEQPQLYVVVRYASFAFVCWLAWQIAISEMGEALPKSARPLSFWQGALFEWVNPKGWIFPTSALATFIPVIGDDFHLKVALLTTIFVLCTALSQFLWASFGATIGKLLHKNRRYLQIFNVVMALILVATAVPTLVEA